MWYRQQFRCFHSARKSLHLRHLPGKVTCHNYMFTTVLKSTARTSETPRSNHCNPAR